LPLFPEAKLGAPAPRRGKITLPLSFPMIRKSNRIRRSGSRSSCWCSPEPHASVQVGDLSRKDGSQLSTCRTYFEPSRLSDQIVALVFGILTAMVIAIAGAAASGKPTFLSHSGKSGNFAAQLEFSVDDVSVGGA
jgi:hypothetical protein